MLRKARNVRQVYTIFLMLVFGLALFILGTSALMGNSPDLIVSDGNGYYAWVRSLLIDGDIDFENDFQKLYFPDPPPEILKRTPKGLVPNKYPIGLALIETPGFLLGHLIAKVTPFEADGLSLPYQIPVTLSLVLLILSSFYLFYIGLNNYGISNKIAFLFCAMPLVGTNLIHYVAKEPTMAHGSSVALTNILVFMASLNLSSIKRKFFFNLLSGLLIGLLFIVRNSNVVLIPFFILLFREKIKSKILPFLIGIGLMLFLQQLSLFFLWGRLVINSYQDEGFTGGLTGCDRNLMWIENLV